MCIIMTTRIASQFSHMDKNEAAYAEFIKEKVEKAGGQIKFQHITGHLSQLDFNVRQAVGSSPSDLRKFLNNHKELFTIDQEGFVSFQKSSSAPTENNSREGVVTSSNNNSDSLFPTHINDAPGIVIKVLPTYGFIAIKQPVKTSVYFTSACVIDDKLSIHDDKGRLLTDIADMLPGKKVRVNAKKANTNFEAKYRATRVWTPANVKNEVLVPNGFHPKVPKDGLYDPISIEGSGKIQKIFEHFGFITNDNSNENIFFHKQKVCNVQNIMNLSKVFSPGDSVEFKAIRSTKKDIKVKWEASKVWIKKQGKTNLFKTEDSSGIGLSENESHSQKSNSQQKKVNLGKNIEPKPQQQLKEVAGKVYPHSDGVVIKFGKHDAELADADSCPFYLHGGKVQDVCWEFSDGDKVLFDGIKIKSAPGWKALLAWVGVKPNIVLPIHVGDFTEFSDDDSSSLKDNFVPDLKSRVFRPSEFNSQPKHDKRQRSRTPNNRSRVIVPSSASSQVSNSSSRSFPKSHTSVDRDFDLQSDDTMSSVSVESRLQVPVHSRRRQKRRTRNNPSKPIKKFDSRSSLTDDAELESEDSYSNNNTIEFHNSRLPKDDKGSNILSRATLSSCVSSESLDVETTLKHSQSSESLDFRKCLQPNPDLYKDWGDTPYPEEEENEVSPVSEDVVSVEENSSQLKDINKASHITKDTTETFPSQSKSETEIFHSDDEFRDAVQTIDHNAEVKNPDFENEYRENLLQELSNSESAASIEVKSNAYIKYFRDLEGKILKVYCKFAEMEHSLLRKSVSVLWNDLYHNGVPVSDKFDDMKEVIKPGQTIKFNCIEILDDAGSCWQKVTVAWKGQRPIVKEMTPKEYISQNYLNVSVDESEIAYGNQPTSKPTEPIITNQSESSAPAPPRKFLAVASCSDDEEEEEESNVPSVQVKDAKPSQEVPEAPQEHAKSSRSDVQEYLQDDEEIEDEAVDNDGLAEAIGQMIANFADSELDIRTLSEDIINLVRSRSCMTQAAELSSMNTSSSKAVVLDKENQTSSEDLHNLPVQSQPNAEMRNSQTQTIITGEVIAQSIFTL